MVKLKIVSVVAILLSAWPTLIFAGISTSGGTESSSTAAARSAAGTYSGGSSGLEDPRIAAQYRSGLDTTLRIPARYAWANGGIDGMKDRFSWDSLNIFTSDNLQKALFAALIGGSHGSTGGLTAALLFAAYQKHKKDGKTDFGKFATSLLQSRMPCRPGYQTFYPANSYSLRQIFAGAANRSR